MSRLAKRLPTWLWVAWQYRPILTTHSALAVRLDAAEAHGNEDGMRLAVERNVSWWNGYAQCLRDGLDGPTVRAINERLTAVQELDAAADAAIERQRATRVARELSAKI